MTIHLPAVGPDLPTHPYTGLRAIGFTARGPVWPVLGASDPPDPDAETDADPDPDADKGSQDEGGEGGEGGDDGADQLGDAGKKALDRMKTRLKAERDRAKDLEAKLAAATKTGSDDKPDPEKIRDEARKAAQAEVLEDRVLDKIEARARRFADPDDAAILLMRNHDVDDFLDDEKIDVAAIDEALAELLKRKPHLAAQAGGKQQFGAADQGTRSGGGKQQITEAELKRMSPEEIDQARRDGRLNDLLGVPK